MKTIYTAALASALTFGLAVSVQAQTIPSPANPTPADPIATNGTPLPVNNAENDFGVRSLYAPFQALANPEYRR